MIRALFFLALAGASSASGYLYPAPTHYPALIHYPAPIHYPVPTHYRAPTHYSVPAQYPTPVHYSVPANYSAPKPKYTKCFQCSYRPPTVVSYKVPKKEEYEYKVPKTTFKCDKRRVQLGYTNRVVAPPSYGASAGTTGAPPVLRGGYGHQQQKPAYRYAQRCYPKVEYEKRIGYRASYEEKTEKIPAGGFGPCMGPITAKSARVDGVDDWDYCHSNCYTRTDAFGNVDRGCYKGEYGVNPSLFGCHYQAGQKYCFCKGDHCNGDEVKASPPPVKLVY